MTLKRSKRGSPNGGGVGTHRSPQVVADALSTFLERNGLLRGMEDHRILSNWREIVGPSLANETRPVRIDGGTLWIDVINAPQANLVLYLKPWILKRIREQHPGVSISTIRIQHRPVAGRRER